VVKIKLKKIIMAYAYREEWLIDDVLNPNSKFWEYNKHDIDALLTRISPLQTKELFRVQEEDPILDQFSQFVDFFSKLTKSELQDYMDFIEDNECELLSDQLWTMIDSQDRRELFNNDANSFDTWYKSLQPSEVEFYMTRLVKGLRMVPPSKVLPFIKKLEKLKKISKIDEPKNLKSYRLDAGKFLTVQVIGEKLAISSKDTVKLESAKKLLVSRGNYFLEERYKISPNGDKIYTYLFLTKDA